MKLSAFQVTRYLFLLSAVILAVFGVGSLMRSGGNAALYVFYALAMFGDAALMLLFYFQLGTRKRLVYGLAVTVLLLNIILTIFDQVGLVDILFMFLNLIALVSLYLARKEFLPA
jgi:hypothetical protein